jgi:DNA-binding Lrp family transcriptional regulator
MKRSLDGFDVQLLNLLQRNNQLTADEMSKQVPLSASAIGRRLRSLRAARLIEAEVAILSPSLFGDRLRAAVQVQLREHADAAAIAGFRNMVVGEEDVQACLEVSGAFDILLLTISSDMAAFTDFADRVLASNPMVSRYETSFIKKVWKSTTAANVELTGAASAIDA